MENEIRSIQHFDSIEDVLALFEKDVVADELRNLFCLEGIEYLWTKEGNLIPSITAPFSSPYLYRGQTERHQPCLPGVFRGLKQIGHPRELTSADKARCFVERVRLEEFCLALESHPASAYAREIGLRMYPYALAQHYEMETDRIDLTQDHLVAAFFATNSRKNGIWSPVGGGIGVLYRLHLTSFYRHFRDRLECIGKQALPRPGEQKAYVLSLPFGLDFESLPVEIYTFSQIDSCGQRFNDHFDGGCALFPPDVMSELASSIREAATIPLRIVIKLLAADDSDFSMREYTLEQILNFLEINATVRVSDREPICMTELQRIKALAAVENMKSTFLNGVGALAVRNVK